MESGEHQEEVIGMSSMPILTALVLTYVMIKLHHA